MTQQQSQLGGELRTTEVIIYQGSSFQMLTYIFRTRRKKNQIREDCQNYDNLRLLYLAASEENRQENHLKIILP